MPATVSDTGTQLLEAAYQGPHDPAVALIYADCLDENDRPDQAELVHLMADADCWEQGVRHARRGWEWELIPRVREQFETALPRLRGVHYGTRFGLPVAVAHDLRTFRRTAADLAAAGVRWLRLNRRGGLLNITDCPALAAVTFLDLSYVRLSGSEVRALLTCPHLSGLRGPSLHRSGITWDQALALAESPHLRGLRLLDLAGNDLADGTVTALAYVDRLPELEVVELGSNDLDPRSGHFLSNMFGRGRVTRVRLNGNPIGDSGVGYLTKCEGLARVRGLDLARCGITTDGVLALVECPHLDGIDRLNLVNNPIGPRGWRLLKDQFGDRVVLF